jgi:hypothetical protein
MDEEMLEAHVAFEVAAWTDSLTETLGNQTDAVFDWLDTVSMGSVFSEADLDVLIETLPVPDLSTSVLAAHTAALEDGTTVGELVRREDYDRVAQAIAGMTDLQEAVVDQITTSEVYADLISHVLYHGIRNYVMTESPIARVPGASSLMRFGQNAFDSAAPRLSKGIEKQLTAFVSANLQDTLRESRQYLTSVVDEQAMSEVADDVYSRNADSTVSETAALIPADSLAELLAVAQDGWAYLITTPSFRDLLQAVLEANAARPVGELLAEAGITSDAVVAQVRPWILRAADDGLLEEQIRERLTAFYSNYE